MRKNNRRSNAKKERIIMIASSGFVLAALTMTGIYMKTQNAEVKDDGYTLDLAELQKGSIGYLGSAEDAALQEGADPQVADGTLGIEFGNQDNLTSDSLNGDDAMDYMPLEVGSGLVEIPGLTDAGDGGADTSKTSEIASGRVDETGAEELAANQKVSGQEASEGQLAAQSEETAEEPVILQAVADDVEQAPTLCFAESDGLLRPVGGEVLLPYSMDGSIYFSTLDHYKYNPALMLSAEEGTTVAACAAGKVVSVFEDAQIGTAVTMDMGNGYQITYGQLKDVTIGVGDYVSEGQVFAGVAAPTKYFSVEGSNLYLKVTAEGAPVNPEVLFR